MRAIIIGTPQKIISFFCVLLAVAACSGAQKTGIPPQQDIVLESDTPVIDSTKIKDDIIISDQTDSLDKVYPKNRKDTYQLAYVLPFFLKEYPNLSKTNEYYSNLSFEYWWGAKLAFDTLESIGFNAGINIYDTRNDSAQIASIGTKLVQRNTDLIIGPIFPGNVAQLVELCDSNSMNLLSPLAQTSSCEPFSNRILFAKPSTEIVNVETCRYITEKYDSTYPVFIFCREVDYEKSEAEFFEAALGKHFKSVKLHSVNSNYVGKGSFKNSFPDSSIVIITSERESFVSSVLAEMRRSLKEFTSFGSDRWLEFQATDFDAWERLNTHFISTLNIDYCNSLSQDFIRRYRKTYHAEPSKYAISGYSDALYFGMHLHLFGTSFQRYFGEIELNLPHNQMHMEQDKDCGCYFNSQVYILRLKDHELVIAQ